MFLRVGGQYVRLCTQGCLMYFCVAPYRWIQMSEFFKCEIHVAVKLFSNISVDVKEIHTFGTNFTAELTIFSLSAQGMFPCCEA